MALLRALTSIAQTPSTTTGFLGGPKVELEDDRGDAGTLSEAWYLGFEGDLGSGMDMVSDVIYSAR